MKQEIEVLDNFQNAGIHFDDFIRIVRLTKYEFFTWNGLIYHYNAETGICTKLRQKLKRDNDND
jgi:hypothetical protein